MSSKVGMERLDPNKTTIKKEGGLFQNYIHSMATLHPERPPGCTLLPTCFPKIFLYLTSEDLYLISPYVAVFL